MDSKFLHFVLKNYTNFLYILYLILDPKMTYLILYI
jgi:hypothetical protein